eukprot:1878472-Pleurochrysis_carterae.AAC.5
MPTARALGGWCLIRVCVALTVAALTSLRSMYSERIENSASENGVDCVHIGAPRLKIPKF